MLNGIEVLNQMLMYDYNEKLGILFWASAILVILLVLAIASVQEARNAVCITFSAIFILSSLYFGVLYFKLPTTHTEYQVTISDKVNFKEFNDKYEIIKQEGKIYTIVEKEKE